MIRAMKRNRQSTRRGRLLSALTAVLSFCPVPLIGADAPPILRYGFQVEERLPMDRANFTQGLQIVGDRLYVGTGMYGESRLREYSFPDLTLEREHALPETLFGEGVTRLGDRIFQLTWRAGQILIYNALTLERISTAEIQTEGWGLTHDGESLIYSDGTPVLRFLDPDALEVTRELTVTIAGRPLPRLNELEYIDGEIWANVWMANQLVRISPTDGRVIGIVDLRGLLSESDRAEDTDVLNGIAWDSEQKALWVTGKRWPWMYRVRIHALPSP